MVFQKNRKDTPYRVAHVYFDGRTIVESHHYKFVNALIAARRYKAQNPYNNYVIQAQTTIETSTFKEYKWETRRSF